MATTTIRPSLRWILSLPESVADDITRHKGPITAA
jgi:hypothetical protein